MKPISDMDLVFELQKHVDTEIYPGGSQKAETYQLLFEAQARILYRLINLEYDIRKIQDTIE